MLKNAVIAFSLLSVTIALASSAFANSLEDRLNSIHPNTFVDFTDVTYDGHPFLAYDVDKLCQYLGYPKGVLSYEVSQSKVSGYGPEAAWVIENGKMTLHHLLYDENIFTKLRCSI